MALISKYKYYYIYKTTNLINGKIYVGQRRSNLKCEDDNYLGSGTIFKQAIKKYGKENFKKELIEYVKLDDLNEREIYWISKYNCCDIKIGYNRNIGGGSNKGYVHSQERKYKISEAGKGVRSSKETQIKLSEYAKNRPKEHRDKIGASHKNKIVSEETRLKMSLSRKGKPSKLKGRRHTEEYKHNMSIVCKKIKKTDEWKINIGRSLKGKIQPKVKCPYCNKIGGICNMKRYHFENCKLKN